MKSVHGAYHTHATLCDGKDTLADMAAAAFAQGVRYYGVSCHSHTPLPLDAGAVLPQDMADYRTAVLALREEYRGRMEILLGLEWDGQSDADTAGLDYFIASAHYQKAPNGICYCADWSAEHFERCRLEAWGGDALAVTEGYFAAVRDLAQKRPPILGHFDLITKHNRGLFDEAHPRYMAAALDALHAFDPKETLLEVNTGGMARGYRSSPYPAQFLLREWRAMGGRIVISSDAHTKDAILWGYDLAGDWARAAGFSRGSLLTLDGEREYVL